MKGEMSTDYLNDQLEKKTNNNYTSYSNQTQEEILWKSFKEGDMSAYAIIYRKYFFVLYQFGKKKCNDDELVKDTIQDLFVKIWNNRENLKETTSIKYYLLTAMRRKLLDAFRSPRERCESEYEFMDHDILSDNDEGDDLMLEKREEVLQALTQLSSHQQKLLHLKFYKNLTSKEIAEELNITIQSVYNAVFKALRSLRKQLTIVVFFLSVFH